MCSTSVGLSVTASVGVAFAGPGEKISDDLVVEADTAMYQAKRKGGAGHQAIDMRPFVEIDDPAARATRSQHQPADGPSPRMS